MSSTPSPQELVGVVAAITHETTRFFNATLNGPDSCSPPWPDAPQWLKDTRLWEAEIIVAHPEITPEDLHTRWCEAAQDKGWSCGELDPDAKTMPSLVPWEEINEPARSFDRVRLEVARFVITHYELDETGTAVQ